MQVLKDYRQSSLDLTPVLSERASITLELQQKVRNDYVLAAVNPVDGLELKTVKNNDITSIIFVSDRVSLEQVEEFRENYNDIIQQYDTISKSLTRITTTPIVEGKVTGFNARLRGMRIESNIGIEIPYGTAFSQSEVRNAFSFTLDRGEQILNPDVDRSSGGDYIITPQFGKSFRYLDTFASAPYQAMAASELNIPQRDIVYVGITTTSASNINPFSDD